MRSSAVLAAKMSAYQAGDLRACAELFRALAPRLLRWLKAGRGDHSTAEDLLQEVFLRIHRARARYRAGSPVLPWVFVIARNVALSDRRAEARRGLRERRSEERTLFLAPASAPEDPRMERIEAALAELPAPQREAVALLKVEGRSIREVAVALGVSEGAVKLRAHRAYRALREKLREPAGEARAPCPIAS